MLTYPTDMICNVYSFDEKKEAIHIALCGTCSCYMFISCIFIMVEDSVDTPTVLHHMRALVTLSNSYISECKAPNVCLLIQIAKYLTYLLKVMLLV